MTKSWNGSRFLDEKIVDQKSQISTLREELERLFSRKEELIRVAAEFRRAHYDDPGSVFVPGGGGRGTDINVLLEELLRGVITGADYWSRAQRRHRWQSRPAILIDAQATCPPSTAPGSTSALHRMGAAVPILKRAVGFKPANPMLRQSLQVWLAQPG